MSTYKEDPYADEILQLLSFPEEQMPSHQIDPMMLLSQPVVETPSDSTVKMKASNPSTTESTHCVPNKSNHSDQNVNAVTAETSTDKAVQNLFLVISARIHTLELISNWIHQNQAAQAEKITKLDGKLAVIMETVNQISNDVQAQGSLCQYCGSSDLDEDMSEEDISDLDLGPSGFTW
ncbi:hypothetical protein ACHAPH_008744 [Verticillium nonalfalfae]